MNAFRVEEDMPIESGMLTRSLEGAQKKVETYYYDIRKRLPAYLQAAFLGLKTPAEALAGFERETRGVLRNGGPSPPNREPGG